MMVGQLTCPLIRQSTFHPPVCQTPLRPLHFLIHLHQALHLHPHQWIQTIKKSKKRSKKRKRDHHHRKNKRHYHHKKNKKERRWWKRRESGNIPGKEVNVTRGQLGCHLVTQIHCFEPNIGPCLIWVHPLRSCIYVIIHSSIYFGSRYYVLSAYWNWANVKYYLPWQYDVGFILSHSSSWSHCKLSNNWRAFS